MLILGCGGRDFIDLNFVNRVLDYIKPTEVVHGAAKGADLLVDAWAKSNGAKINAYPADWSQYGKRAGYLRNKQMLDMHPDIELVVAFPGGRGTEMMVQLAQERGVPTLVLSESVDGIHTLTRYPGAVITEVTGLW